jgi:hypothetical protein
MRGISFSDVTKRYGAVVALDGFSADIVIAAGEALLAPSITKHLIEEYRPGRRSMALGGGKPDDVSSGLRASVARRFARLQLAQTRTRRRAQCCRSLVCDRVGFPGWAQTRRRPEPRLLGKRTGCAQTPEMEDDHPMDRYQREPCIEPSCATDDRLTVGARASSVHRPRRAAAALLPGRPHARQASDA